MLGATCWTTTQSSRLPPGGHSSSMSSSTSCSACLDSFSSSCPSCRNTRSNRFVVGLSCDFVSNFFGDPPPSWMFSLCVCRTSQRPGRNSGDVSRCYYSTISVSSCLWSVELITSLSFSASRMTGTPCHAGQWNCFKPHLNTYVLSYAWKLRLLKFKQRPSLFPRSKSSVNQQQKVMKSSTVMCHHDLLYANASNTDTYTSESISLVFPKLWHHNYSNRRYSCRDK